MSGKYLVWSAVAVLLAVLLVYAQVPQRAAQVSPQSAGRFQIVFSPYLRADTFLLDTETGKVWSNSEITDVIGRPTVWFFRERIDSDQEFAAWATRQTFVPGAAPAKK